MFVIPRRKCPIAPRTSARSRFESHLALFLIVMFHFRISVPLLGKLTLEIDSGLSAKCIQNSYHEHISEIKAMTPALKRLALAYI